MTATLDNVKLEFYIPEGEEHRELPRVGDRMRVTVRFGDLCWERGATVHRLEETDPAGSSGFVVEIQLNLDDD